MNDLAHRMALAMGTPSPGDMGDYPPCNCGHSSPRHHGDDRSGGVFVISSRCKDCMWCDRYMPTYHGALYEAWAAERTSHNSEGSK